MRVPVQYFKIIRSFFCAGHNGSLALLGRQDGGYFTHKAQHARHCTLGQSSNIHSRTITTTDVYSLYAGANLA